MKLVRYFLVCIGFYALFTCTVSKTEQKGYENHIETIQEIGSSKFLLTLEHENPICNYAPESYAESLNDGVHRFFLPRTTINQDIDNAYDIQSSEQGTELVFHAQGVRKIISGNKVLFIVQLS